ncbi:MAG: hypothetical protein ABW067_19110 [Rhizobacter sp.]
MPDSIHPRLLARVERSLRKRLNVDIGPHLQRFAAQARTEDDFMTAAARLLVNPREREEWLASWATRRLPGDDTAPMGLDSTPAPLDAPATGPGALVKQRSFRISPAQLTRIREALAHEVGPIAALLIETESARSESAGELLARLQAHLDDDDQRNRFVAATLSRFDPEY